MKSLSVVAMRTDTKCNRKTKQTQQDTATPLRGESWVDEMAANVHVVDHIRHIMLLNKKKYPTTKYRVNAKCIEAAAKRTPPPTATKTPQQGKQQRLDAHTEARARAHARHPTKHAYKINFADCLSLGIAACTPVRLT